MEHELALSHRGERSVHDAGGSMGMGLEELLASRRGSSGAMTARTYDEYLQYREEFGKKVVSQSRVYLCPFILCLPRFPPKAEDPLPRSLADTEPHVWVAVPSLGDPLRLLGASSTTFF